jgi:hypothetical protein
MKRILALAIFAVAACVGFNSAASAETATATFSGTITPTCTITGADAPFNSSDSESINVNGTLFPRRFKAISKFTTLCNTASSSITVEKNAAPIAPASAGAPVYVLLTQNSASAYAGNSILNNGAPGFSIDTVRTGTISHNYGTTPSDLDVFVQFGDSAGSKILPAGNYTVVMKATLTP